MEKTRLKLTEMMTGKTESNVFINGVNSGYGFFSEDATYNYRDLFGLKGGKASYDMEYYYKRGNKYYFRDEHDRIIVETDGYFGAMDGLKRGDTVIITYE